MLVCLVVGVKFENAVECSMVLNNLWHSLANLLLCLLVFFLGRHARNSIYKNQKSFYHVSVTP